MKTVAPGNAGASHAGRFSGLLLGGAVALLLIGVFGLDRARAARIQAEHAVVKANVALAEARGSEQLAQQNRKLLAAANAVQQHAQLSSILPLYWSERQFNLRQQSLPRDQLNPLLQSIARNNLQFFKPEDFDLSVTHPDEGLFDIVAGSRQPILLSLRGPLYFRISERPL